MAKSNKQALGRGLDAILGEVKEAYENNISNDGERVVEIEIKKIVPNPYQPRKVFRDSSLQELADSIREYGILQPVLVYPNEGAYILIAGERRLRASQILGYEKIKAIIAKADKERLREVALIENIQREDLNPIDLARAYEELLNVYQLTHDELGKRIQKSRAQISNTLRMLDLSPFVQKMLVEEKITQGHAKILVPLPQEEQEKITKSIIGQKLSVRKSEELLKALKNKKKKQVNIEDQDLSMVGHHIAKKLRDLHFCPSLSGKKLIITFENKNEMERFLKLL